MILFQLKLVNILPLYLFDKNRYKHDDITENASHKGRSILPASFQLA